jgi:hypothetical protein
VYFKLYGTTTADHGLVFFLGERHLTLFVEIAPVANLPEITTVMKMIAHSHEA